MKFYRIKDDEKYNALWYNDSDEYKPFHSVKCPEYVDHRWGEKKRG